MYLLQGDNEVDRERAADAATVHLLHLQFILAQVVAVDTDLARLVFDNDDFSPGSRKPPGDMQKERRFAGANIICNADRHSPMCAWPKCESSARARTGIIANWMKPAIISSARP